MWVFRGWILDLQERWASGEFSSMEHFATAQLNAKALGAVDALQRVVDLDYQQLVGELDGKQ